MQISWGRQIPYGAEVQSPSDDLIDIYVPVPPEDVKDEFPAIDYKLFEIPPNAMTDEQRDAAMTQLKNVIETQHANFMGFQANQQEKYSDYAWLLNMHVNNIGDPFTGGLFNLNSKFCERAVLDYFAALWNIDWPHTEDNDEPSERYWGYVLSMGFTEGNIYGLYNARDYVSGKMLIQQDAQPEKKIGTLNSRQGSSRKKDGLFKRKGRGQ